MKDFSHPNILGLAGVCFDTADGVPYIILPFMANGDLRDFLKNKRIHLTNIDTLPEVIKIMRSCMYVCHFKRRFTGNKKRALCMVAACMHFT